MPTWPFTSLDWYRVTGRGDVAVVTNPQDFQNGQAPYLGKEVTIDGTTYTVLGVESFAIPIIRQGVPIGLLVKYRK